MTLSYPTNYLEYLHHQEDDGFVEQFFEEYLNRMELLHISYQRYVENISSLEMMIAVYGDLVEFIFRTFHKRFKEIIPGWICKRMHNMVCFSMRPKNGVYDPYLNYHKVEDFYHVLKNFAQRKIIGKLN